MQIDLTAARVLTGQLTTITQMVTRELRRRAEQREEDPNIYLDVQRSSRLSRDLLRVTSTYERTLSIVAVELLLFETPDHVEMTLIQGIARMQKLARRYHVELPKE